MPKHYQDPQGRHVRIYCTLLDSPAWRVLGVSARALFLDLRSTLKGTNNGNLSAPLTLLKHRGWNSSTTLAVALYELQATGFLVKTRGGGVERGSKVCSLYGFTDVDVLEHPKLGVEARRASHAYRLHESVSAARQVLQSGVAEFKREAAAKHAAAKAKADARRGNSTLQKVERDAPESGAMKAVDAPESGADAPPTLQKVEQTNGRRNGRKPAPILALQPTDPTIGTGGPLLQILDTSIHCHPSARRARAEPSSTGPKRAGKPRAALRGRKAAAA